LKLNNAANPEGEILAEPCPDIELLAAYIDENITPQEHEFIERHLDGCARCLDIVAFVIASKVSIPDPIPPSATSA